MIFVWVKGIRRPLPEKWPDLICNMNGKVLPVLACYDLPFEDAHKSLDHLAMKYPPPAAPKIVKYIKTIEPASVTEGAVQQGVSLPHDPMGTA